MNLSLSPEIEKIIRKRIKSGNFSSAEDVVSAAVRRLEISDRSGDFAPGELDALLEEAERSMREEGTLDGDKAFKARQKKIKANAKRR